MNNYFKFNLFGYEIRAKHVRDLWFSERNEINCNVYLFYSFALIIKRRI